MDTADKGNCLIIGLGNEERGDDAVGLAVVRRIRDLGRPGLLTKESCGDGTELIELWKDRHQVRLVDAVFSGQEPGTLHRLEVGKNPVPSSFLHYSTHSFGLGEAVELARVLDLLPPYLVLHGIEGTNYRIGRTISTPVHAAIEPLVAQILGEIHQGKQP